MALFKILKGNKENLPELKREGFAYFTIDENDFYVDTQSSDMDTNGNFLFDNDGKPIGGTRKQLNANRAHYVKSKDLHKNSTFDQLYIDDEEISLGRTAGESAYEGGHVEGGSGLRSIAVGSNVSATGNYSQAFGSNTTAEELNATAFGKGSISSGEASFAEGIDTEADHDGAHAEGISTKAQGDGAHAEGNMTQAKNYFSHAEGNKSITNGYGSHAEGYQTLTGEDGSYAHAEGSDTQALGYASHAEGNNTMAEKEGAHSEGLEAKALGEGSHAEGNQTEAQGNYSHAEGTGSLAIGVASHAEGEDTEAIGIASHAEGNACIALGNYSHAGGNGSETEEHEGAFVHGLKLYAQSNYQTVFGKYSDANENDAFVIGNGTAEGYESNAFKVQWDGTAELKETLLVGRDPADSLEVATKQYVDRKINTASDDKMYSFTTQTTGATDTITFSNDSVDVNACLVYYNGLLLILGENYTVSDAKTIVLNGWNANAGDFFTVTGKQGSDQAGSGSLNCGTVGSASKPVYFLEGIPVACSNNLEVSITGASAKATLDSKDQNIASTYFKSVAWKTGLANSATPQLTLTKGDNTTVNLDIDYRVKQNVLTSNSSNIPLLLKSTGQKAVDEVNYSNALTYNINSGYLYGASIDCGEWIEGDIDPTCCFVSGTQILVDLDGDTKNIEDMKPGDLAVAYDIEKEINYMAVVKDVIVKDNVVDVAKVKFENGATLKMNAYHPIYTTNGWHSLTNYKNYDTLLVDDICRTSNGWSKIVDIERYYSNPLKMYTLNLVDIDEMDGIDNEANDNFFANGIVVHNAGCATN